MKRSTWVVSSKSILCRKGLLSGLALLLAGTVFFSCNPGAASSGGPTPPLAPLYVDDFEDGDLDNTISDWRSDYDPNSTTRNFYGIYSTPPGYGDYTMRLSMDMPTGQLLSGDLYWEYSGLNTGPTATASPIDVTEYGNFAFSLSFEGAYSGLPHHSNGYLRLYIYMSGDGGTIKYTLFEDTLFNDFVNGFSGYSIPLDDFAVNSGTLADLKQAIEQIQFSVWLQGDNDDAVSYELILDELRFEE